MHWIIRLAIALIVLTSIQATAESLDPFTGVWSYDPALSTGGEWTQTLTITVRGNEETYLSDLTDPDGTRSILAFVVRYDGVPIQTNAFDIAADGTITATPIEVTARTLSNSRRLVEHRVDGRLFRRLERSPMPDRRAIVSELTEFDTQGRATYSGRLVFVNQLLGTTSKPPMKQD